MLLVIDDDQVDRKTVIYALKHLGSEYRVDEATCGSDGLKLALICQYQCIIIDYNLPDINGLDLLKQLHEKLCNAVPIIMLTGEGDEGIAVEAMKDGACDYLPKSKVVPESLCRAVSNAIEKYSLKNELAEADKKLRYLALYDPLTGLGNRNLFYRRFAEAVSEYETNAATFVTLVMDLDKFKSINDIFGHEVGDLVLATVGSRLRDIMPETTFFFRLGGDEFTAILSTKCNTKSLIQNIITTIAQPFTLDGHTFVVEVSVGHATYPTDGSNQTDLFRKADKAMYEHKESKRTELTLNEISKF